MHAAERFLTRYDDPPAVTDSRAEEWWNEAALEFIAFSDMYGKHPLASKLITVLFVYIELKAKAKGGADAVQEQ